MDEELLSPAYKSIVDILSVLDNAGDGVLTIFEEAKKEISKIWKLIKN